MKKQFSHRRSNVSAWLWSFGATFVVLLLLFLIRIFLPAAFVAMATPLWKAGSSLDQSLNSGFSGFDNAKKLAEQNVNLSTQVVTLQDENAVLTARAQDLTKLLGGQNQSQGNLLAGILVRPPESPYDTLVVSAGSADGVSINAQVYAPGGVPIGTVKSLAAHTSVIDLYSSNGQATGGWVGENRTPLTLTGKGGGAFTATLPTAASVSVGDTVYVPGPGALPIGTITAVDTDPSSPTAILQIQPLVDIFSLTWVEIAHS